MERTDIIQLFQKYLDNRHTKAELVVLLQYFGQRADNNTLKSLIQTEFQRLSTEGVNPTETDEILAAVDEKLPKQVNKYRSRRHLVRYSSIAALIIAALAVALFFYRSISNVNRTLELVNEIKPGGNRATLTLADGRIISLDSAQSGIIIGDKNIKYQSGELVQNIMLSEGDAKGERGAETSLPTSLTLSIPKGGQYQIILSDGTKVWLNAASTLRYPSRFSGNSREVEITGEAFFEIKEDKSKSFKVLSKNQEVLVLGTSFNISSYESEESVRTTLVTGALQVVCHAGPAALKPILYTVKLAPGEQSILKADSLIKSKTDIYSAIAWKENKFSFDNKPFTQIMTEMGRWYNFEVTYEGPIPTNQFMGDAYRTDKFSTVLRFLENAGLGYRVEATSDHGHRLVIINKKGDKQP